MKIAIIWYYLVKLLSMFSSDTTQKRKQKFCVALTRSVVNFEMYFYFSFLCTLVSKLFFENTVKTRAVEIIRVHVLKGMRPFKKRFRKFVTRISEAHFLSPKSLVFRQITSELYAT